jgi:hypothetical protein
VNKLARYRIFHLAIFALWLHVASTPLVAKPESERREVQRHGYVFEKWVRDAFFQSYEGDYTQEWDVAREANRNYGEIPVSIKTAKYGGAVDLGDALRQYSINQKFLIIIGYWKQEADKKRIVNIVAAVVEPDQWKKLWEPITRAELQRLDAIVKNRVLSPPEARAEARKIKSAAPFSQAVMGVNPKIDSRSQRRLQCSLSFKEVFKYLAPDADSSAQQKPALFGVVAPEPFVSAPRRSEQTRRNQ